MPLFAFRLDTIHVGNPRGKVGDDDVVTFGILVNQIDRGHAAGFFPDLVVGSSTPAEAITPNHKKNTSWDWIVGPFEISAGDVIHIVYSGTNTSDSGLSLGDQDKVEIKILDTIVSSAVGAIGGPIGSLISSALGLIGDPVGKFLGYKPMGPCNGLVFSDAVEFSGSGLGALPLQRFTRSYTDPNHNSDICGEAAHIDVSFSVLRLPYASLRSCALNSFQNTLKSGVRRLAPKQHSISVRTLMGLRL